METTYFKRSITEGSVKATHVCSFDKTIVLTKLVQKGTKVIDSVITNSSLADRTVNGTVNEENQKSKELNVRNELRNRIKAVRINGMPTLLEDLGECFDDDEVIEVVAFINDADMSKFGGSKPTQQEAEEENSKNV